MTVVKLHVNADNWASV